MPNKTNVSKDNPPKTANIFLREKFNLNHLFNNDGLIRKTKIEKKEIRKANKNKSDTKSILSDLFKKMSMYIKVCQVKVKLPKNIKIKKTLK